MKILLALIAGLIGLLAFRKQEETWLWVGPGKDPFKENT